jgi:hypothetical protein
VAHVLASAARRIARLVESRAEGDGDALARDEPLLTTLAAASLRSRVAVDRAPARANTGDGWATAS